MKSSLASATSLIALLSLDPSGANAGTISLAPTLNFGDYYVQGAGTYNAGITSTAAADTATITSGSGTAFTFSSVSGSGFSGAAASVTPTSSAATTLTNTYTFNPSVTGAASTTVTVSGSGATSVIQTLIGTGVAPIANITGSTAYFLVGQSGTVTTTITNTGNGNSANNVSNKTATDLLGSYNSASNSAFTNAAGNMFVTDHSSTAVAYTFTPTVTGATTATVNQTFANGAASTNVPVAITATLTASGVAPIANLSGSSNYLLVGSAGTVTVTATNTGNGNKAVASGNATLAQSNLNGTIGSASGGLFTGGNTSISINDGGSTAVSYTFTPSLVGAVTSASVTGTFTNGAANTNSATNIISTITATGVAPINSVTTNAAYVRVGTSGTATVVITNAGNGNSATNVSTSISNLNGSVSSTVGTGVTASGGNPTSISLNDRGVSTLSYTYAPTSRGTSSSAAATISFSDGSNAMTNAAQTVTATVSATGVGPIYKSVFNGTTLSPTAVANGATATTGPTVSLGTLGLNSALTSYMTLQNTSTDANNGQTTLTDLTIKSYSLSGANPNDFQVSLTPNSVLGEGGTLSMPIKVTGNTLGLETATLTVFTDESTAYGGAGDTFTYILSARVPEPATVATLGAGLAGLAFMRRRRKTKPVSVDRSDEPG